MTLPPDPINPHGHCSGAHHSSLTCKQIIVELLQQYLEDGTPPDITRAITEHITACPPCVRFVDEYKLTREIVHELRFEDIPHEFTVRLSEVIRVAMRAPREE